MAPPPPGSRVLITGVTGYIGFHILLDALRAGWTVLGTSRSQARLDNLASNPAVLAAVSTPSSLELIQAPDSDDEAEQRAFFTAALRGITHVVHTAAPLPLPHANPTAGVLRPTIAGARALLAALAAAQPPPSRLVVTSSFLATLSPYPPDPTIRVTPETRAPAPSEHALADVGEDPITAYRLGKGVVLRLLDEYAAESSTDVVIVFPGFVHGGHEGARTMAEFDVSTMFLMRSLVTGVRAPMGRVGGAIHIKDTAAVHVAALDEERVPRAGDGKPTSLGATIPVVYDDTWGIVQKHFPEAVAAGVFTQGSEETWASGWDSTQTEKLLGMKFRSYEEMVVDFAKKYIELLPKSSAGHEDVLS
ncbi:hypothetical protein F4810DRAFT_713598 [Camillea tinctor]|nr:hypothetical protein F4810DRAFT_713598 [Camillea tinctor]